MSSGFSLFDQKHKRTIRPQIEQQADFYAILSTAQFLKSRFDGGMVDPEFYFKRMKNFHNELQMLQQELSLQNETILEFIQNDSIDPNFRTMIGIISSMQDYELNQLAAQWQLDPYLLATNTVEITSNFITLIDYLHIIEDFDPIFLSELIADLKHSLQVLSTYEVYFNQVTTIENQLPQYFAQMEKKFLTDPEYIKASLLQIENIFYDLFQEFRRYLQNA